MRWLDGITGSMDMNLSKLRDTERQGSLVGYSSWGCKELDITERLNDNSDSGKTAYPKLTATPTETE